MGIELLFKDNVENCFNKDENANSIKEAIIMSSFLFILFFILLIYNLFNYQRLLSTSYGKIILIINVFAFVIVYYYFIPRTKVYIFDRKRLPLQFYSEGIFLRKDVSMEDIYIPLKEIKLLEFFPLSHITNCCSVDIYLKKGRKIGGIINKENSYKLGKILETNPRYSKIKIVYDKKNVPYTLMQFKTKYRGIDSFYNSLPDYYKKNIRKGSSE